MHSRSTSKSKRRFIDAVLVGVRERWDEFEEGR